MENPTLRIGEPFGRFEIADILPAGGQGEVYRAKDPTLQRDVAIKLLLASDPHDRERFMREARTAAGFSHPNIVSIFECGTEQRGGRELPYLVMEFIEGASLRERMRDASKDQLLRWLCEVADGLAVLHRRGVVHRDLKPANIMIGTDDRARIVDFGLAKAHGSTVTSTGTILGTVDYFSPEQADGLRRLDYRTDIFSFGIVLYEALTGKHPFRRATDVNTMRAIHLENPERIRGREGEIVARCLQKTPTDRYDDAADIARDLREWQSARTLTTTAARSAAPVDQDAKTVKITSGQTVPPPVSSRRRWRVLGLLAALLLAGLVAVYKLLPDTERAPQTNTTTPTAAAPQPAPLATCGLSASPGTIKFGGAAELRWTSTNAADIVIRPDVGIVGPNGSIDVSPRVTTTYEVVATNADGVISTSDVTIKVVDAPAGFKEVPVVGSIGVGPDTIRRGQSTTLSWNSFHTSRVVITPNIGIVPLTGSIQVSPKMTTTYTMALTNSAGGFATGRAIVNVEDADASVTQTASPTREVTCATATQPGVTGALNTDSSACAVPAGQRVTQAMLHYTLDDGGSIVINGRNVFTKAPREGPRQGTVKLPVELFVPGTSFLLKVEARNALKPDGTTDGEVYGKAVVRLMTIDAMAGLRIMVSPGVIKRGETAHLTWSSVDASTLVLNPLVGPVAPSGSMTVSPTQTTTYVLRGWSASGDPATASATVTVE